MIGKIITDMNEIKSKQLYAFDDNRISISDKDNKSLGIKNNLDLLLNMGFTYNIDHNEVRLEGKELSKEDVNKLTQKRILIENAIFYVKDFDTKGNIEYYTITPISRVRKESHFVLIEELNGKKIVDFIITEWYDRYTDDLLEYEEKKRGIQKASQDKPKIQEYDLERIKRLNALIELVTIKIKYLEEKDGFFRKEKLLQS